MKKASRLQSGTRKKYLAVQARYKELYEKKRIRYDDVIKQLMDEFFYEHPDTIMRILRTEIEVIKKPALIKSELQ